MGKNKPRKTASGSKERSPDRPNIIKTADFQSVKEAGRAAHAQLAFYRKMMKDKQKSK